MSKTLLSIVEIGGYPNFIPLYRQAGYAVETLNSMRKAMAWLKRNDPEVVVAEFNYDPMFRDRMSSALASCVALPPPSMEANVESLLATLQRKSGRSRVILFIEPERLPHLEKVLQRYSVDAVLEFPIDAERLHRLLDSD